MTVGKRTISIAVLVLLTASASTMAASVSVEKDAAGRERLILENNLIRLEIDPQRGARADSFKFKPWGDIEIIQIKGAQGLFVDHFWQEVWPGQFWEADYSYEIISRGPDQASVKFSCLSQNKTISEVAGILLEKTIVLKENSPTVRINISLTNNSQEGKYIGYWLQNVFWLGGDKEGDYYFRPSVRGISKVASGDSSSPDEYFVREPQAGWTAAIDERTKTGLVFLMDYNYLWYLYNCTPASTVEWQYDAVAIPPQKTWQTEISLIPIANTDSLSSASENILAGVELRENGVKNLPRPVKQKTLLKPEKIVRTYKEHPQVFFLKGLLSGDYKLEAAIEKIDPASQIKNGYAYTAVFGPQLDYFPYDYDTLMSLDLIVIGDVSVANIGDIGLEMIADYCEHGGNLLVLGGPFAYGNGGYKGTVMDEILPVLSQGPFDMKPVTGTMKLMPGQEIIKTRSLKTLKLQYIHATKAKPDARVLLTYGGYPFLAAGTYGSGNVICITGTSLGDSSFCDTREWQEVLAGIFDYLGVGRERLGHEDE